MQQQEVDITWREPPLRKPIHHVLAFALLAGLPSAASASDRSKIPEKYRVLGSKERSERV